MLWGSSPGLELKSPAKMTRSTSGSWSTVQWMNSHNSIDWQTLSIRNCKEARMNLKQLCISDLHCLQDMQHACGWHRASHWCCPWQPWHNQLQLLPEHLLSKLGVDTHSQSTTYYELSTIQSLASQKQILRSQLTVKHVTPCTWYNYQMSQIYNTGNLNYITPWDIWWKKWQFQLQ